MSASEITLCRRVSGFANNYWICKDALLTGDGIQKSVAKMCSELQKLFVEVGNSNNFFLLVAVERIMCIADLRHFLYSQGEYLDAVPQTIIMRTLQEGVDQMAEINDKLAIRAKDVKAFHTYSSYTQRIKGDHDRKGLPKDGIRKLLPSHRTRLENKNRGMDGVSDEELSLIGLRHANIRKAEQLYMALQHEALGGGDKPKQPAE